MTLENIFQAHSSSCLVILTVLTIDDLIHWLCKYWINGLYASTGCPDLLLDVSFPSWKNKETLGTDHSQNNLYSTPDLNVKTRFLHSPCFCLLCEPFPISCRTVFHDKPWQFFKKLAGFLLLQNSIVWRLGNKCFETQIFNKSRGQLHVLHVWIL